jgi:hypothetical protein
MSAHAYAPAPRPGDERERQPRLFALPGGAAAPAPVEAPTRPALAQVPAPVLEPAAVPALPGPAREVRAGRTLDSELRLAWTALTAGAPAACIMCGGRMEPRTGAAGGACTSCGTTLE